MSFKPFTAVIVVVMIVSCSHALMRWIIKAYMSWFLFCTMTNPLITKTREWYQICRPWRYPKLSTSSVASDDKDGNMATAGDPMCLIFHRGWCTCWKWKLWHWVYYKKKHVKNKFSTHLSNTFWNTVAKQMPQNCCSWGGRLSIFLFCKQQECKKTATTCFLRTANPHLMTATARKFVNIYIYIYKYEDVFIINWYIGKVGCRR